MRIITDSVDVELEPTELMHFNLKTAKDVRDFIRTVRIEIKNGAGFKTTRNRQ